MNRRDLLLGAGCVAALAGAEALRPRRIVSLMGDGSLADLLPRAFAGWQVQEGGDIVTPKVPGTLAARLYSDTVARTYVHSDGGPPVMLLAAHGDSQSDLLQLHRPEVCYRAFGFAIDGLRFASVQLAGGGHLPAVEMIARADQRVEDVLYWTRLGEYLPLTSSQQRTDRLRTAMSGAVADGVLVRMSSIRIGSGPDWQRLGRFAADLIEAVPAARRAALIGNALARSMV